DGSIKSTPVQVVHAVNMSVEKTGLPDRDWLVIESEVQPDDLIVVSPTRSLTDGLPVLPVLSSEAMASLEQDQDVSQ
ncbi:MAG: hypothetical protein P8I74_04170, partial [Phycisphaerales bacterium]|nr:hypothetical protein [Phycisphaerales bacterium]